MNGITLYKKQLHLSELQMQHSRFLRSHLYDAGDGKENASFGFLTKGTVSLCSVEGRIEISAGSLFYIPEGQQYRSIWTGDPDIEFYSLHMVHSKYNVDPADQYPMQNIPAFSNQKTQALFQELFRLLSSDDTLDSIQALGLFYSWYATILPHLHKQPQKKLHPVFLSAIDFIHRNYLQDFTVQELAEYCHISESRLYHLFRQEIGSTPIQFRNEYRIEKAALELRRTDRSIDEIADRVGFHSDIYFRKIFKKYTGMTPSEYRKTMQQNAHGHEM